MVSGIADIDERSVRGVQTDRSLVEDFAIDGEIPGWIDVQIEGDTRHLEHSSVQVAKNDLHLPRMHAEVVQLTQL